MSAYALELNTSLKFVMWYVYKIIIIMVKDIL